jgi:hypothetical protein
MLTIIVASTVVFAPLTAINSANTASNTAYPVAIVASAMDNKINATVDAPLTGANGPSDAVDAPSTASNAPLLVTNVPFAAGNIKGIGANSQC